MLTLFGVDVFIYSVNLTADSSQSVCCIFRHSIKRLTFATLIKKKIKFSSYIRRFRVEQLKVIYEEGLPIIYEEKLKYLVIFEEADSHI
jgi:hypothetical protein